MSAVILMERIARYDWHNFTDHTLIGVYEDCASALVALQDTFGIAPEVILEEETEMLVDIVGVRCLIKTTPMEQTVVPNDFLFRVGENHELDPEEFRAAGVDAPDELLYDYVMELSQDSDALKRIVRKISSKLT